MNYVKPSAAPGCWGAKYQDGDEECRQCAYSDTCKSLVFARLNRPNPDTKLSLPVMTPVSPYNTPPRFPVFAPTQVNTVAPLSEKSYASSSQVPLAKTYTSSPPQNNYTPSATPPPQSYNSSYNTPSGYSNQYSNSSGYYIPDPAKTSPFNVMHRPGATAPPYYFTQYPNESVTQRLGKNVLLRGLEAIFYELMQFFKHWTWPST